MTILIIISLFISTNLERCGCDVAFRDYLDGGALLGRPTATSVDIGIRPTVDLDVVIGCGAAPGVFDQVIGPFEDLEALHFYSTTIAGLQANTHYFYQLATRPAGASDWTLSAIGEYHTARATGETFRAAFMADEHLFTSIVLNRQRNIDLYQVTIDNIAASGSDFFFSLGDFASCECNVVGGGDIWNVAEGIDRYMLQRRAIENATRRVPFYLAIGNHDGEQGWKEIKELSYIARSTTILNPESNGFYSAGPRNNYFSWQWGDALFVVLDPFTYTLECPHRASPLPPTLDGWTWTIGVDQYNWLYQVLQTSTAKWTVICLHHLTSTTDDFAGPKGAYYGRGAREVARNWTRGFPTFEWGGEEEDGSDGYPVHRAGFNHGAIHPMLSAKGNVIVLHGHDHAFAYQELEGVKYVLCPQPANADYDLNTKFLGQGGYLEGVFLPNSGYLTLDISESSVVLRYYRSYLPGEGNNNEIVFEQVIQ